MSQGLTEQVEAEDAARDYLRSTLNTFRTGVIEEGAENNPESAHPVERRDVTKLRPFGPLGRYCTHTARRPVVS